VTDGAPINRRLVLLIAATTAFEGLRAGAGTFRLLLDLPARTRLGDVAFAEFSRATDLSTAGVIFYSIYGLGGAALTIATWAFARRTRAPVTIRRSIAVAAACSLLVLALTTRAAPLMFGIGASPNDPELLADLFDRFIAWTIPRIVLVDVSFVCMLVALTSTALRAAPDQHTMRLPTVR